MSKPYLDYFSYEDWDIGEDDKLRVGDLVAVDHQDPVTGAEQLRYVTIVRHHSNNLPVFLYGNDYDGDYWDIQDLFMSGWTFSRCKEKGNEL